MNFYALFLASMTAPFLSAALICAVSWLAAVSCFVYGYLSVGQRTLRSDAIVRDERAARAGWSYLSIALFLHGVGALSALGRSDNGRSFFAVSIAVVPLLFGAGLLKLLSPCHAPSTQSAIESAEYDEENEAETEKVASANAAATRAETPKFFVLARVLGKIPTRSRALILSAIDAFIMGGSVAALSWWIGDAPGAVTASAPLSPNLARACDLATVLWFVVATWIVLSFPTLHRTRLALSLPESSTGKAWIKQNTALKPVWAMLLASALLFGLTSARLDSTLPVARSLAKGVEFFDVLLLAAAILCCVAASWFLRDASSRTSHTEATPSDQAFAESEVRARQQQQVFLMARNFLTLLLPCAAAATGTWYVFRLKLSLPPGVSARDLLPGAEIWWNALLLLSASLRHLSLNLYENFYSSRRGEVLQHSVENLREEVAWRTQQLTTLHTVSADLNNTLSHEQVLNLALQRLMEAVRADAGAVWLLEDFEQIAANKTRDSRSPFAAEEEQKRRKTEQKTDSEPIADTSSTRSSGSPASPLRRSLADVFDAEQEKASVRQEAPAPEEADATSLISRPIVYNAEQISTGRKRLGAAIQSFNSLQNLSFVADIENGTAKNGDTNGVKSFTDEAKHTNNGDASDHDLDSSKMNNGSAPIKALPAISATQNVSGHGLRRSRPLRSGFKDDEEDADVINNEIADDSLEGMEGDGVYVSGPVGSWGTFVASSSAVPDNSARSTPVPHLVSHTRDTYGTPKSAENIAATSATTETTDAATPNVAMQNAEPVASAQIVAEESVETEDASPENSNGVLDSTDFIHHNWRLVRANGYDTPVTNRALEAMNRALEEGGIVRCARLSASWFGTIGDVHLAPIKWHGEVIGVLSVTSRKRHFQNADRRLLEALATEVSGALRNSYVYQQARRWAERDSITNLFNHRAMQEKLGQELIHARNFGTELTVVMMDLNNFKFFNDTYGHPVGDRVLETVAQCLRESCRTSDVLGRYGGDEFIAVLPNTSIAQALDVCRRIEEHVEQQPFSEGGDEERRIPIGLSFGASVYPHDGKTPLELLTVADAHLYDAKRGGSPLAQMKETEETQELRKLKAAGESGSFGVLDALVTAIDHKDNYTRRHSEDVTHWAVLMARELGFSEEELRAVRISGLLHDVGKIAVPDSVLRKPGRLNDDEFAILQQHPVFGALIVKDVPNLPEVLGGIRHHHERFDGKGYPDKLSGEKIPLMGRLLAVPDCFSAMTTNRPYRKSLTWAEAFSEIERCSGTQFDPQMADAFLEVMARIVAEQVAPLRTPNAAETPTEQPEEPDTDDRETASAAQDSVVAQ